jgi:hypothetical protein
MTLSTGRQIMLGAASQFYGSGGAQLAGKNSATLKALVIASATLALATAAVVATTPGDLIADAGFVLAFAAYEAAAQDYYGN